MMTAIASVTAPKEASSIAVSALEGATVDDACVVVLVFCYSNITKKVESYYAMHVDLFQHTIPP